MNRTRAKQLAPIIQAFADGKEIQTRYPQDTHPDDKWFDTPNPSFGKIEDGVDLEYRIKPEPFECWVLAFEDGSHGVPIRIHDYYMTKGEAKEHLNIPTGRVLKMREVE